MPFILPRKVPNYLARLHQQYQRSNIIELRDLIANATASVREGTEHDNWNGGVDGHDVCLYLSLEDLHDISLDEQLSLAQKLCDDLNKLASSIGSEYFHQVHIEIEDETDAGFQKAVPMGARRVPDADDLSIWKPGFVRLFVSHKDRYKGAANVLAEALEEFGISCFVAHDTIEPMSEWREEIMRGLDTMEAMLVFLTDDFSGSTWTNQEVGFALGKEVPVISLKLEKSDPPGFISHVQALKGRLESPDEKVEELYGLVSSVVGNSERMSSGLVRAFVASHSFGEAMNRFDRMERVVKTLTDDQLGEIVSGFHENDQLYNAGYLTSRYNRLTNYLRNCTGVEYEIAGRRLVAKVSKIAIDEEIPF